MYRPTGVRGYGVVVVATEMVFLHGSDKIQKIVFKIFWQEEPLLLQEKWRLKVVWNIKYMREA